MRKFQLKDFLLKKLPARKTSLVSASAVGLLLAGTAEGQERDTSVSIEMLESLESWSLTETGDLRLVFENGAEQIISASDFTIVDGTYYISETLAGEILAGLETGIGAAGVSPAVLGLGGLGGLALAAGGGGGGGGSAGGGTDQPPVTPPTDNAPAFTSDAVVSVAENQTAAITVAATDADGDAISYAITGGADSALFSINATSGVVTFITAPDFEMPSDAGGDNTYDIVVSATAGGQTVEQTVAITVTNADEAPVFTSAATASVAENQTAVMTVAASDVDGDPVTYAITGGADSALFSIDQTSGAVTFNTAPNFEAPSDAGGDNVYDIVVSATAGGQTVEQTVAITVTNADEAPVFTSAATALVAENQTAVMTVAASDVDGDPVTYAITGGADSASFSIDQTSGAVTFITSPDFEAPSDTGGDNTYDIVVSATAGGQTVEQTVAITVTNADEAPVITSAATVSALENQTAVMTVSASDADGDPVTYAITGADSALFLIDENTGVLTFNQAPDREAPADADRDNTYDIVVSATAGGQTVTQNVAITVSNVEEDAIAIDLGALIDEQGFVIQGAAAGDWAGHSVSSAGDVNGDGIDDLIVGARFADPDGNNNAGEAYVIYGGTQLSTIDLNTFTDQGNQQGFIIQGDAAGDSAGRSVSSAGDVNGDGFDDLIVGAPFGDDGGTDAGEAYVIYGGVDLTNINLSDFGGADNSKGFIIQGAEGAATSPTSRGGDRAGISVSSAGDVNGDGYDDLIVGAARSSEGGNQSGAAYVVFGGPGPDGAGIGTIDLGQFTTAQAQGFLIKGASEYDLAGRSVSSAGDVNGDGFDDLIVGAPYGGRSGEAYVIYGAGQAYVIYGGATGSESTVVVSETGTSGANNFTGNAGDDTFDGIGTDDVVRGGAGDDAISVTSLDFADIDGGHGTDTLVFNGADLDLDLSTHTERIDRIEIIDLTGSGDNSLTLDELSVLNLSEAKAETLPLLTILGDAGDTVDLSDTGWGLFSTVMQDGITFSGYVHVDDTGAFTAALLVQDGVTVTLQSPPVSAAASNTGSVGAETETVDLTVPDVFDLSAPPDASPTLSDFGASEFGMIAQFGLSSTGDPETNIPSPTDGASDPLSLEDEMSLTVDLLHLNDAVAVAELGG